MGNAETIMERSNTDQLLVAIRLLQASLEEKHPENVNHMLIIEKKVDLVLSGFPDNDPEAHRRYHESIIEWRELRNKMVREALIKMAGAGAIGGAGWLAYAMFQAIKTWAKS